MTNNQIIYHAAVSAGIYTEDEANAIIISGDDLPIHTYKEWQRLGYQVKKGETAALSVNLWGRGSVSAAEDEDDAEKTPGRMYRSRAYLFTSFQVEPRTARKVRSAEELRAYNKMLADQRKKSA